MPATAMSLTKARESVCDVVLCEVLPAAPDCPRLSCAYIKLLPAVTARATTIPTCNGLMSPPLARSAIPRTAARATPAFFACGEIQVRDRFDRAACSDLRPRAIRRGDLLRHFDVSIGHPSAEIVPGQLESDFSVGDAHVRVMVNGLEVGDQAVDEAERRHE